MKRVVVLLLAVCLLTGCSLPADPISPSEPAQAVFLIDSYHLQLTADSTFYEKSGTNFDLYITNERTNIGVMPYKYIDLPTGLTPLDVFDMQNEDLFSLRSAVTVIEEAKTQQLSQHTLTQALYSAENDGNKNYYATYLLDFPAEETFAWVLVVAMPSYLEGNREYLDNIVYSLSPI